MTATPTSLAVGDVFLRAGTTRWLPARIWSASTGTGTHAAEALLTPPGLVPASAARFALPEQNIAAARVLACPVSREAILRAPAGPARPVILVSPGRGDPGWTNAGLCAAIARSGAVAIELSHPGDSPALRPDGTRVDVPADLRAPDRLDGLIDARVADLDEVLAALAPDGEWGGLGVDSTRVSALGHSLGGAAAAEAASRGSALRSVVVLDGSLQQRTVDAGIPVPTLILSAERDPVPGWAELGERTGTAGAWLSVSAAEHYSMTELGARGAELGTATWSAERRVGWLGSGDPERIWRQSVTLAASFLSSLGSVPQELPDGWREQWRRDPPDSAARGARRPRPAAPRGVPLPGVRPR